MASRVRLAVDRNRQRRCVWAATDAGTSTVGLLGLTLLSAIAGCRGADVPAGSDAAPAFGRYENREAAVWDGSRRHSEYVEMPDGTRLALDYFLPTRDDAEPSAPLPVVLRYTREIRAMEDEDGTVRAQAAFDPVLQHLLRHGYAVAVADARGTGASFGAREGPLSRQEADDAQVLIEWLGAQAWSNGRVGMTGRGYSGAMQYQAASRAPPALRAIFAEMAPTSLYDLVYGGGAYKNDFTEIWASEMRDLDLGRVGTPARTDADPDGADRDAALGAHARNIGLLDIVSAPDAHRRDYALARDGAALWSWEVAEVVDDAAAIVRAGVGIYHLAGWYDLFPTQQARLFANLDGAAQKLTIGPWLSSGSGYADPVHLAEILRWFDYWLKGIDNGVLDEPPVHYYVMRGDHTLPSEAGASAPGRATTDVIVEPTLDEAAAENPDSWRRAQDWPPDAIAVRRFYLAAGPSGSVASLNDGALAETPAASERLDSFIVDYGASVGSYSRWANGYGLWRADPLGTTYFDERTAADRKALTYTTAPLEADTVIVGHPVVDLWVTSTHADGDFFAYLEEIDADGRAHLVTEGVLRASHRRVSSAPFENLGLPFHRSAADDLEPLAPGEPARLRFDLIATAVVIDAGHRIRISIAGADASSFALHPDPSGRSAPTVEVLHGGDHASLVELPILDTSMTSAE